MSPALTSNSSITGSPEVQPSIESTASQSSSSASSVSTTHTRPPFHWTPSDGVNMANTQPTAKPTRSLRAIPAPVYEVHPRRSDSLDEKQLSPQPDPQRPSGSRTSSSLSSSSHSWQEKEENESYHDDGDSSMELEDSPLVPPTTTTSNPTTSITPPNPQTSSHHHTRSHSLSRALPQHELIDHQRHYGHRVKSRWGCITVPEKLKPWLPMCAWFATTIGFIIALAFWRKQVFQGLDDLASYLKRETYFGQVVLFSLILITTFPPLPLYSTFMMLAGYTFGAVTAFFISYFSSLLGALLVFLIFRHFVPASVAAGLLPPSLKRVVRAIEHRPSIFLLIRVAPYPYNVLNAVLGSCSDMSLGRYIGTTSISLLKVIAHTSLGSTIRSFKDFHAAKSDPDPNAKKEISWGEIWTGFGVFLCVVLFIYLFFVARKAVDEECEDDEESRGGDEYEALPTTVVDSNPQMSMASVGVAQSGETGIGRVASANPFVVGGEDDSGPSTLVGSPRRTSNIPLIITSPPSRRASIENAV